MKGDWDVPEDSFGKPVIKGKKNRPARKDTYSKSKSLPRTRTQSKIRSQVIIEQ
jgi:ATP-dependent RNA helicase DeaD